MIKRFLCALGFHKPFIICQDGWFESRCLHCMKLLGGDEC